MLLTSALGLAALVATEGGWDPSAPAGSTAADGRRCRRPQADIIHKANLTQQDSDLLPQICWDVTDEAADGVLTALQQTRQGIPPGVKCSPTQWCVELMAQAGA